MSIRLIDKVQPMRVIISYTDNTVLGQMEIEHEIAVTIHNRGWEIVVNREIDPDLVNLLKRIHRYNYRFDLHVIENGTEVLDVLKSAWILTHQLGTDFVTFRGSSSALEERRFRSYREGFIWW